MGHIDLYIVWPLVTALLASVILSGAGLSRWALPPAHSGSNTALFDSFGWRRLNA